MGVVIGMFMRDHHQIELSNLTLAYQDTGEGEAVVLLHGFCAAMPILIK